MKRLALTALGLAVGCALALPAGAHAQSYPQINWVELLPPLSSPTEPQPGPVAHCRRPTMACIDDVIRRLRAARDRYGCDHRAVFATTYLVLTKEMRDALRDGGFDPADRKYLYTEDALFANMYLRVLRAWEGGGDVPGAWQVALEAAESGDFFGAQDMLLGINAHVQNDMPFLLAALGLRTPDGASRKPDHDAANVVLSRAYERVVAAVRRRFDPSLDLTNPTQVPIDDLAGLEAVRGWREIVWRNAERLTNADTRAERRQVAASIESYAQLNASLITAVPAPPGYRATRDAYCEAQLNG